MEPVGAKEGQQSWGSLLLSLVQQVLRAESSVEALEGAGRTPTEGDTPLS